MVVLAHAHTHTYTNLVVEELDVLDGLMEHRCRIRLHAHREISRFSEIVHIDLRLDRSPKEEKRNMSFAETEDVRCW
jgi:hypothetical protein